MAKKKKKAKKITKAKLKKMERTARRKALKTWSLAVRARDGNKCVICSKVQYLNAHHILNKFKFPQYALELMCGISLCPQCHQFGKFAAETNAVFFGNWLLNNRKDQWDWVLEKINYELTKKEPADNLSQDSAGV